MMQRNSPWQAHVGARLLLSLFLSLITSAQQPAQNQIPDPSGSLSESALPRLQFERRDVTSSLLVSSSPVVSLLPRSLDNPDFSSLEGVAAPHLLQRRYVDQSAQASKVLGIGSEQTKAQSNAQGADAQSTAATQPQQEQHHLFGQNNANAGAGSNAAGQDSGSVQGYHDDASARNKRQKALVKTAHGKGRKARQARSTLKKQDKLEAKTQKVIQRHYYTTVQQVPIHKTKGWTKERKLKFLRRLMKTGQIADGIIKGTCMALGLVPVVDLGTDIPCVAYTVGEFAIKSGAKAMINHHYVKKGEEAPFQKHEHLSDNIRGNPMTAAHKTVDMIGGAERAGKTAQEVAKVAKTALNVVSTVVR